MTAISVSERLLEMAAFYAVSFDGYQFAFILESILPHGFFHSQNVLAAN